MIESCGLSMVFRVGTEPEMGTGYSMSYTGSTKIMYFSLDSVALGFRVCVLGIYSWKILRNVLA